MCGKATVEDSFASGTEIKNSLKYSTALTTSLEVEYYFSS